MDDRDRGFATGAYSLWEREGQPEGKDREHWQRASSEIDAEDSQNNGAGLSNDTETPLASVGSASGLQPSGTSPGSSPASGPGSIGTGGASTGGASTGNHH